jgi:hypothetical protein
MTSSARANLGCVVRAGESGRGVSGGIRVRAQGGRARVLEPGPSPARMLVMMSPPGFVLYPTCEPLQVRE